MKLKYKLSITIGLIAVFISFTAGTVAIFSNSSSTENMAKTSLSSSSELGAKNVADLLNDYLNIATATGYDQIIVSDADVATKKARMTQLVEIYGFTSGNILDANGISIQDGNSYADRDYVTKALAGEANVSEVTLSKLTGKYGVSIAAPIMSGSSVKGVVYYRMDADFLQAILDNVVVSKNATAYIVDNEGKIVYCADNELIDTSNITDVSSGLGQIVASLEEGKAGVITYKAGENMYCSYNPIENSPNWNLVITSPKKDFLAKADSSLLLTVVVNLSCLFIAIVVAIIFANRMAKKITVVDTALRALTVGDFDINIEESKGKDEIASLQNSAYKLKNGFTRLIGESNEILGGIASYDLQQPDMDEYPGEYNELANSINKIKNILHNLIQEVMESSSGVNVGSGEIANATDLLSRGTVTQANSISQVVDDINNVSDTINRNLQNSLVVEERLNSLNEEIQTGNDKMNELRETVVLIEEMTSDIQDIVSAIESIAFQTNILALNASVEAARAGEVGRGFAVVADEVGALAQRSSEASQQTADLIGRCVDGIRKAMKYADITSEALANIVRDSDEIAGAFAEIAEDTKDQASKASNIQREMSNVSDVVSTNTATAEETAAATQELSQQAKNLGGMISRFKL